jgi:hypothetical protein
LLELLEVPNAERALAAAFALRGVDDPQAIEALRKGLGDFRIAPGCAFALGPVCSRSRDLLMESVVFGTSNSTHHLYGSLAEDASILSLESLLYSR